MLNMPETVWKSYIDMEIELKDFNNTLKTPSGEPEVGSGNFTSKK